MATYASGVLAPFARGNAVLGGRSSVEGVQDELARRFAAMTAAMPPEIKARVQIASGFRDAARQAEVYRGSGTPPPMNSRHMHGLAMDLGNDPVVLDWINQHGREHGLGFPLRYMGPKEFNHLEMVDSLGNRVPVGGAPAGPPAGLPAGPDFGGGSDAAPVYADTGDPQFKSGLAVPQAPPPEAPDPARQAALTSLALQQTQSGPLGAASGFNAPTSLGDTFAQAVKAGQPAAQPPSTILGAPQYTNVGGPIPLARRIG
jgi:hypothetical protein